MSRNLTTDRDFLCEVCDWLRANDVDPRDVPAGERPSIADGQLTLRRFRRSELTGTLMIDPANPLSPLTEVVTVPVLVKPSPEIAEWLRPRCPTCGR